MPGESYLARVAEAQTEREFVVPAHATVEHIYWLEMARRDFIAQRAPPAADGLSNEERGLLLAAPGSTSRHPLPLGLPPVPPAGAAYMHAHHEADTIKARITPPPMQRGCVAPPSAGCGTEGAVPPRSQSGMLRTWRASTKPAVAGETLNQDRRGTCESGSQVSEGGHKLVRASLWWQGGRARENRVGDLVSPVSDAPQSATTNGAALVGRLGTPSGSSAGSVTAASVAAQRKGNSNEGVAKRGVEEAVPEALLLAEEVEEVWAWSGYKRAAWVRRLLMRQAGTPGGLRQRCDPHFLPILFSTCVRLFTCSVRYMQ